MFSSFKERLNTTVKNLAESERLQQASGAVANGIARARTRSQQSPPQQRSLSQDSRLRAPSVEAAERLLRDIEEVAAPEESSSPGLRTASAESTPMENTNTLTPNADDIDHGSASAPTTPAFSAGDDRASVDGVSVMSERAGSIRERRLSVTSTASTSTNEMSREVRAKLEKLQRYEARFPDIAKAYKLLLREKKAIEGVMREVTPLEGIGDVQAFEDHLRSMNERNQMAKEEIQRLSSAQQETADELLVLRGQLDSERAAHTARCERLERQIAAAEREIANSDHMSLQSEKEHGPRPLVNVLRELEVHLRADASDAPDLDALLDDTPAAKKALHELQSRLGEIAPLGGVIAVSPRLKPVKDRDGTASKNKIARLESENGRLNQRVKELEVRVQESQDAATKASKTAIAELEKKLQDTQTASNELEGENKRLRDEAVTLREQADASQVVDQLREQLDATSRELESLRSESHADQQKHLDLQDNVCKQLAAVRQSVRALMLEEADDIDDQSETLVVNDLAAALAKDVETAQQCMQEKNTELMESRASELAEKDAELAALRQRCETLTAAAEDISELQKAQQQVETIRKEKDALEETHKQASAAMEAETATLRERLAEMEKDLEEADNAGNQKGNAGGMSKTAAKKARRELNEARRKLETAEKTITILQQQQEGLEAKAAETATDLETAVKRIAELETSMAEAHNAAAEAHDSSAAAHADSIADLQKKLSEAGELVTQAEERLCTAEKRVAELEKEADAHKTAFADVSARAEELAQLRDASNQEAAKIRKLQAESEQALQEAEKAHGMLKEEAARLRTEKAETETLLQAVQEQLATSEGRVKDIAKQLETAVAAEQRLNAELKEARATAAEGEEKITKLVETLKSCKRQIERLQREREDAAKDAERQKCVITNLEETVKRAAQKAKEEQTERQQLRSRVEELTTAHTALERKEAQTSDQLQVKRAEYDSAQSALEMLRGQLAETRELHQQQVDRVGLLEEELATSRELFGEKSTECDGIKTQLIELQATSQAAEERLTRELHRHENRALALVKELDALRATASIAEQSLTRKLQEATEACKKAEAATASREDELRHLEEKRNAMSRELTALEEAAQQTQKAHAGLSQRLNEAEARIKDAAQAKDALDTQLEESTLRESHLRSLNKTLKDEVRRMQRQLVRAPPASSPRSPSHPGSAAASTPADSPSLSDHTQPSDSVNMEYLRHVLFKFIEFKGQRPQLIPVLAMLLKLAPQDLDKLEKIVSIDA
ncbi:hypothetical protein THASP1DRAFT_22035 [Thamnocephalis sphaerospora]|uniref:GRIP domain-containing protein n=1 Tax=Thamnocephalis sphaerospora TaxID=78915 RepID=A0A4V1IX90_9FUNG|nr:hypothetical protein THASP1DRAFT_22035 [Thamnocephalis sphaerospora]|eukprot:RKP10229.1 hypothetical protein THASP1DRAFT_22035 [Thamnocephalis sphaerospora]